MKRHLQEFACSDKEAIYLNGKEGKVDSFLEDYSKILRSNSFRRSEGKTQVYPAYWDNDHITNRMMHMLYVSNIASKIGRELGLNEDLIKASALGHDLGHTPYGHEGERILNEISLNNNEGYFHHAIQSARNMMFLENHGEGLNVSLQVIDAALCHNGDENKLKHIFVAKTKEKVLEEYKSCYKDKTVLASLHPMTLEGCVIKVSDCLSFLGRDIEDGVRLGKITWEDIPQEIKNYLGSSSEQIEDCCIDDVLNNSYGKNYIGLSAKTYEMIEKLYLFNLHHLYLYNVKYTEEENRIMRRMFYTTFYSYLRDLKTRREDSPIIKDYLNEMSPEYQRGNSNERIAIDYIAGMTDSHLIKEYQRIRAK